MKYIETNEWSISDNGELFTDGYYSREEAIEEVRKEYGRGYIGKEVHVEFDEQDILIPEIEQELSEKLYEEVGEASEYWEIPKDIMKKFVESYEKFVIDFINKNGLQPTCYKVVDIEQIQAGEQE